jgi:hypothetical protein
VAGSPAAATRRQARGRERFCIYKCHYWQKDAPPSLKRGAAPASVSRSAPVRDPPSGGPPPAGDIGPGAPVLVPPRRMGEGPSLSPQMGEGPPLSPQCLARAAGPTPWPGPTARAHRTGRAQGPNAPTRPQRHRGPRRAGRRVTDPPQWTEHVLSVAGPKPYIGPESPSSESPSPESPSLELPSPESPFGGLSPADSPPP